MGVSVLLAVFHCASSTSDESASDQLKPDKILSHQQCYTTLKCYIKCFKMLNTFSETLYCAALSYLSLHPLSPTASAMRTYTHPLITTFLLSQILVYGQSVGSGPSCYLATTKPVAGAHAKVETSRQTDRQTDRHALKKADRQTDRQIHMH